MKAASVNMWGMQVGAVTWDSDDQVARFAYAPDFIAQQIEVSPIMMPLSTQVYEFSELRRSATFRGLPGLLADSLPEKYGNRLMAVYLAERGLSFTDLDPVERLCYLGSRGMGALEFEPDTDLVTKLDDDSIDLDGLLDVARKIMDEHNTVFHEDPKDPNLERLIQIGTSAGGAKAKAVIAWNETTGEIMSGQGKPKAGFNHYLLKLSGVENDEHESDSDVGRMEYAYHLMAINAGIRMMECRLLNSKDGGAHFMTRRFDRDDNGEKLHIQSYCAIAHQDRDPVGLCHYEHLFSIARELGIGQPAITELFKRMVFNILARNQDDHSKNHAFMMNQFGEWDLTPAYDICFAFKKNSRFIDQHQMCCNGKRDHFEISDIAAAAKAAGIRVYKGYVDQVRESMSQWATYAEMAGLPEDKARAIQKHFRLM